MSKDTFGNLKEANERARVRDDYYVKCATPPCTNRVSYRGDFCRDCFHVQETMRRVYRARTRKATR